MTSSISDTTHSPAPFSPFTTHSGGSDLATSDESPDLGAFTIVFRALDDFQPRNFIPHPVALTATTTVTSALSPTGSESDPNNRGSTVWNQHPIASYLSISSRNATTRLSGASHSPPPTEPPSSDTEGEIMIDREVSSGSYDDNNDADEDTLPSLGYLAEALQFIAAERAKLTAPRDISWHRGSHSRQQELQRRKQQQQQQQQYSRRRRRRTKARSLGRTIGVRESAPSLGPSGAIDAEILDGDDASDFLSPSPSPDISSSEVAGRFKSTPVSPPRRKARHRNSFRSASADARPRLGHSQSTPSLRSGPLDPRVVRLRALAIKLKFLFAAEAELLTAILSNQSLQSPSPDFIDPRGPAPKPGQPLVHVFIDYSNILIGFLTYLRRHPHFLVSTKVRWMSHAALALILERGRSVTRRVLVASSPLYQPMEAAARLGYEVHVVPPQRHRHSRGRSGGSSSNNNNGWCATAKDHAHRSTTGSAPPPVTAARPGQISSSSSAGRVRYREQGVDELLQLKFLQAVANVDNAPPPWFNEEGFRGCVRTALKKGWRVELYAWEGGLSRTWGPWSSRFRIIPIDGFGADLLDG
ncbi:hypothetical protein EDB92DRAFT_1841048 [Lactarius akahatsu]|uniref:PIN domain-containing protein n=1 Tax=Lactarius akahatsu TaxID=416441 RepID=A0AAD4QAK8_9AGAM|nr:hypothetical protein EDB92DRAFT_1841048 [Lactarius akahatsu]